MSKGVHPIQPKRTVRLRADVKPSANTELDNTDYELSASILAPPEIRLVPPGKERARPALDPEARALFQRRLRLCCLVAAAPFAFFTACAATNFIEPFGRATVGWTGLVLSLVTLGILAAVGGLLSRPRLLTEQGLREVEVALFGTMALFFAYWHFVVLTAFPPEGGFEGWRHEQAVVLAAILIVHFNWFALLVFHGVLVPNSLTRGVAVAGAMCLVALAIDTVAVTAHPPATRSGGALFAVALTMLAAGAGLSIFGTAKTEALRREVESAREAVREMGQYRLKRKLGHGGMGEVYLAEHRLIKRPCALKRIHPKYLNNVEQVKRFEREVQATAQLHHPNTVEIYDYGRAEDGTFYYVMEYLPGMSLEEIVTRHGPLPVGRVIHVLRQVCSALREAHRLGLVHRDIKPSNIIVFPHGNPFDQAKVLDFGLVHSLTDEIDPTAKITREGLIVGTPEYMSPEQASGGVLDGRSDLFSVGSVAYFLLTGKEAFHRENPMKTLLAVVGEEPQPIRGVNPYVPDDLLEVVRRCLAKTPDGRFERAADLEYALGHCRSADDWTEHHADEWWAAYPDDVSKAGTDLDSLPLPSTLSSSDLR